MLELRAGLNMMIEEFIQHHVAMPFVILSHSNKRKYDFLLLILRFTREKKFYHFELNFKETLLKY